MLNTYSEHYTKIYTISTDWKGHHYYGLKIEWYYKENYVDISIPNYIFNALK